MLLTPAPLLLLVRNLHPPDLHQRREDQQPRAARVGCVRQHGEGAFGDGHRAEGLEVVDTLALFSSGGRRKWMGSQPKTARAGKAGLLKKKPKKRKTAP